MCKSSSSVGEVKYPLKCIVFSSYCKTMTFELLLEELYEPENGKVFLLRGTVLLFGVDVQTTPVTDGFYCIVCLILVQNAADVYTVSICYKCHVSTKILKFQHRK